VTQLAPPRAILFDWDNTLVDNWGAIGNAMNATLAAMGQQTWTPQEIKARVKLSLRESFPGLFGARWQEARKIYYDSFRGTHLETLRAMPGSESLLRRLGERGLYLGVVSNKTGNLLRLEAAHLGWDRLIAKLVGAGDASVDKPAVEPVELALDGSGIERGRSVWFVGDTDIDIDCAVAAGCAPIFIRWPGTEGSDSLACERATEIRNLHELLNLVVASGHTI
jgi:phosphoglycolate phosphatase